MSAAPTAGDLSARRWSLAGLGFGSTVALGLRHRAARPRGLALAWVELATPAPARPRRGAGADRGERAVPAADPRRGASAPAARWRAHRPAARASRSGRAAVGGNARPRGPPRAPRPRRIAPARLVVRDPLGLCARELVSDRAGELLVLPRIDPVLVGGRGAGRRAACSPGSGRGSAAGRLDARAIEFEIDGLRAVPRGQPRVADPLAGRGADR